MDWDKLTTNWNGEPVTIENVVSPMPEGMALITFDDGSTLKLVVECSAVLKKFSGPEDFGAACDAADNSKAMKQFDSFVSPHYEVATERRRLHTSP